MRGLICKEFIYLKRQNPLVWAFFIFCAYTFTRLGPSQRSAMMWGINICVLTSLLGVSLLAFGPFYDKKSHWDQLARSLPIRSRRIVESRYLCAALIIAAGALLTIGATLVTANGQTDWDTFARICSFSVGFPATLFDFPTSLLCASLFGNEFRRNNFIHSFHHLGHALSGRKMCRPVFAFCAAAFSAGFGSDYGCFVFPFNQDLFSKRDVNRFQISGIFCIIGARWKLFDAAARKRAGGGYICESGRQE